MDDKNKKEKGLVPELRFPEFKDKGEWERKKLKEVANITRGGSPRPIDDFLTENIDGLNWLKIGDIDIDDKYINKTKERIKKEALNKTRKVGLGTLILSNSMSFGRPYITKIEICIHDGWLAINNKSDFYTNNEYLYYFVLSPFCQSYFLDNAAGAVVKNLNIDIVKELCVFIPTINEQQKISDCLSSIDELIKVREEKLELLKKHKKGLMQQLFPNKIVKGRVPPPPIELY